MEALDNRFYVKFMQLEIGLLTYPELMLDLLSAAPFDFVLVLYTSYWHKTALRMPVDPFD